MSDMNLGAVEMSWEALEDLKERHRNARLSLVGYAIRAILDGQDIDAVMAASGFPEEPEQPISPMSMFGVSTTYSRRQLFATWLANQLQEIVAGKDPE